VEEGHAEEQAAPGEISIFDSTTTAQMKLMAEGLAEPTPALPQQDEAPLLPPPAGLNGKGKRPPLPTTAVAEPPDSTEGNEVPAQFSPSSAGAFENLREMLGKLRQPCTSHPAESNGTHGVAERLADVLGAAATPELESATATATATAEVPAPALALAEAAAFAPPPPSQSPRPGLAPAPNTERDALLGRYEALRLQMAAEALSLPLDFSKLADLIRLAGKRFPLVRFSEHELPSMTGRYAMCWSLQGLEVVFGLATFSDAAYWRTLAGFAAGRLAEVTQDAESSGVTVPRLKITTFKTDREQPSWAILQNSAAFPEVLKTHVDPIHLDTQNVAALYAMQRIIKESESGALEATPTQVMSVLARELDFFWKRVTRAA
jgi:hypothetical protein